MVRYNKYDKAITNWAVGRDSRPTSRSADDAESSAHIIYYNIMYYVVVPLMRGDEKMRVGGGGAMRTGRKRVQIMEVGALVPTRA